MVKGTDFNEIFKVQQLQKIAKSTILTVQFLDFIKTFKKKY
jgi:hypothetical protein